MWIVCSRLTSYRNSHSVWTVFLLWIYKQFHGRNLCVVTIMKSSPVAVFMYNVIDVWMQPNKGRILCGGPLILTLVEEQDWRHSPWGPSPASHSVLGAGLGRVQFWKFSVAFHFFFFFFFLVSELQVKHRGPFCLLCFLRQLVNNHYVAVFLDVFWLGVGGGQGLQIYCCKGCRFIVVFLWAPVNWSEESPVWEIAKPTTYLRGVLILLNVESKIV